MAVNVATKPGSNPVPRLLPHLVDEVAAADPLRPFVYRPRSNRPEDGWMPVTFRQLASAIDHVAHIIARTVKASSSSSADEFPTLAYVGPSDVRYPIVVLAAVKAGCKALLVSPRNSLEAQMALFETTRCKHIWYAASLEMVVKTWLRGGRDMTAWAVPAQEDWLAAEHAAAAAPFPYRKTFEEARWDPVAVLHTSGSTGIPKPVVVRLGGVAVLDMYRGLPEYMGAPFLSTFWKARAKRVFMPMPLFHAAGLVGGLFCLCLYFETPAVLPLVDQPVTADLTMRCMRWSESDAGFLAPSILEDLSLTPEGVEALKKLGFVAFGGGNLSKTAGDSLAKQGVVLNNCIASTELAPYALYYQANPDLWQYFIINSGIMGVEWRPHDPDNGIYELALRRKDPKEPLDQPIFYTFPDREEWSTGDLFKAHPTLKDHWMYQGRADNIIVFSNGEKLNPVTIEDGIVGHPLIRGALVVGQDRFQAALILEPTKPPTTGEGAQAIIESVWPVIDELNRETVAHGRISKQLVALSDPAVPFPRASKGTVQRRVAVEAYKAQIEDMYRRADDVDTKDVEALDLASADTLRRGITKLLASQIGVHDLAPDTDFFSAGVDSLQVLNLSKFLKAGLAAAGVEDDGALVTPRVIYSHPTLEQLARHLYAATHVDGAQHNGLAAIETSLLESMVSKYTAELPAPRPGKTMPLEDGQTVILTGSTGSLGAYLLDMLCQCAHVKAIVALNRGPDGGKSRQPLASSSRGLHTDFSKVEFLSADLSQPDLGLGATKYQQLVAAADRIIHNAWPVNFNMSVSSFEPHVRGVRHLVDLSAAAPKHVPIIFISSIGTVANWSSPGPVPEQALTDLSLPQMGYGQSKLAGSLILDAAAQEAGVPGASIRVGQIAGPRASASAKGMWNAREFLPTLVASSVYMGILPRDLGTQDLVDWMAVEDVAGLVLDVAGITQRVDVSQMGGYYHCVNPQTTRWADLAASVKDFFGGRIRELVSMEEWVAALEGSDDARVDENPAIKLLDTYRGFVAHEAGKGRVRLDMSRTVKRSATAAASGPITTELMRKWCAQWKF